MSARRYIEAPASNTPKILFFTDHPFGVNRAWKILDQHGIHQGHDYSFFGSYGQFPMLKIIAGYGSQLIMMLPTRRADAVRLPVEFKQRNPQAVVVVIESEFPLPDVSCLLHKDCLVAKPPVLAAFFAKYFLEGATTHRALRLLGSTTHMPSVYDAV